jgi:hypothetical protein
MMVLWIPVAMTLEVPIPVERVRVVLAPAVVIVAALIPEARIPAAVAAGIVVQLRE